MNATKKIATIAFIDVSLPVLYPNDISQDISTEVNSTKVRLSSNALMNSQSKTVRSSVFPDQAKQGVAPLIKGQRKVYSKMYPSKDSNIKAYIETLIFLLHGTIDKLVPIRYSRDFAAALKAEKYPVELYKVPNFDFNDTVARNYKNTIFNFLEKGVNAAE